MALQDDLLRTLRRLGPLTAPSMAWTVSHIGRDSEGWQQAVEQLCRTGEIVDTGRRSQSVFGRDLIVYALAEDLAERT